MSVGAALRYHLGVDIVGKSLLRFERMKLERKMRQPGFWKHEHLGPPHYTGPWLKELISRHYLKGRYASGHKPVAWVTSGAPVEFLIALGYFVNYPENHAAVCGIKRKVPEISGEAEAAGYSQDLCSYARTDFGSMLSGKTPVGVLPPPDLLVCCTNICQTVLHWYRVLAQHFDCPLVIIDTPFVYGEVTDHALEFIQRQIEDAVEVAERVAKKSLSVPRLKEVTRYAKTAIELWMQILATGRSRPAPITAFDEFIHMAPIVEMRGEAFTVDYYATLLAELEERVAKGQGCLKEERYRLIWDNLPIWHRMRWLSEALARNGATLVASTYTNAWGELGPYVDVDRPIESAANVYIHAILNRGTGHKLATMASMVEEYEADGVILHSDRSCKPYSIGQIAQREKLSRDVGVPALLLEADHNDPRTFTEEQVMTRLSAFLEMVAA